MTKKTIIQIRIYFTGIITVGIWSLLLWNHFHGGVLSHHILHQEDLPAISNWWGGILLPLLTYLLTYRIQKRILKANDDDSGQLTFPKQITYSFIFALTFGILLSVFFTHGYSNLSGYMMYGLLLSAFFFPIYQAEYYLGLVIGMTYTFGAVLPAIVGAVLVLIGALLYKYVRTTILFITRKLL